MLLKPPPQNAGFASSFFSFRAASRDARVAAGTPAAAGAGGGGAAAVELEATPGPVAAGGTAGFEGATAAAGAPAAATVPLGFTMVFSATIPIARSTAES